MMILAFEDTYALFITNLFMHLMEQHKRDQKLLHSSVEKSKLSKYPCRVHIRARVLDLQVDCGVLMITWWGANDPALSATRRRCVECLTSIANIANQ